MKRSPFPPETPLTLDPKQALIDHKYTSNVSPRKMKANDEKTIRNKNKTINKLRARNSQKKKTSMGLMLQLKKLKLLSKESERSMNENFGHIAKQLFNTEARNYNNLSGSRYSQEIREFPISLHVYSRRGYKFGRKSLNLLHPATITSWSVNSKGEPGFLQKSFEFDESKVNEGQKYCVVMLDEMAIK